MYSNLSTYLPTYLSILGLSDLIHLPFKDLPPPVKTKIGNHCGILDVDMIRYCKIIVLHG